MNIAIDSSPRHPSCARQLRRRSADVGGLHLAVGNNGQGQGWVGNSEQLQTRFAELLSDMYTQTLQAVNEQNFDSVPADLPTETRSRLIQSLEGWHFEPHKLPEEELVACTLILFEALFRIEGMRDVVSFSMQQLSSFVRHLRRIYRLENSYHNFEHALDVLQATQSYLRSAGMVPPLSILLEPDRMWSSSRIYDSGPLITCLRPRDLFCIYIAAIGHDVGHPGFSNIFMKNAETPLSLVFDGQSALEQMHCQLLLRVMRSHGLGVLLEDSEGFHFRRQLWYTVMATDMSVHAEFMERFAEAISGEDLPVCMRRIVISQAILKCADISNPSRPFNVSEYWASALIQEWASQAHFEQYLDLKQTVQILDDPLSEAKSQEFFTRAFAKPLLDLMVQAVPELSKYAYECASTLDCWTTRRLKLESSNLYNKPPIKEKPQAPPSSPLGEYLSAFPLTLPTRPFALEEIPSDSSTVSSESVPCSPSDSTTSSVYYSPIYEFPSVGRPGSTSSSSSTNGQLHNTRSLIQESHVAIRAAGKLGVRQQRKINRNSWCAPTSRPSSSSPAPTNYPPSIFKEQTISHAPLPSALVNNTHTTRSSVALLVSTTSQKAPSPMLASPKASEGSIVVSKPIKLHASVAS